MAGVLVMAAGIGPVFSERPDFTIVVIAYVVMRVAPLPVFLVLMLAELAVPDIAERNGTTPWHAHHTTAIERTIPA